LALLNLRAPTDRKNRGSRQRQSLKQLQAACQRNWRFQESHPILLLPKLSRQPSQTIFLGLDGEATRPPLKCGKLLHCARKKGKQLLRITRKYPRMTKLRSSTFRSKPRKTRALCLAASCHSRSKSFLISRYGQVRAADRAGIGNLRLAHSQRSRESASCTAGHADSDSTTNRSIIERASLSAAMLDDRVSAPKRKLGSQFSMTGVEP